MATRKKEFDPDNPPLTREFVAGMRPYHEVHPEYKATDEAAAAKMGRPRKDDPTINLTIRIHASTLPKLRKIPKFHSKITKLVDGFADILADA